MSGEVAFFEVREGRFVSRCFYAELPRLTGNPLTPGNLLGFVFRDEGGQWECRMRLRTYVDDRTDDTSRDPRSAFAMKPKAEDELGVVLAKFREAFGNVARKFGAETVEEVVIDSEDPRVVLEHMGAQRWNNRREERIDK